MMIKLGSFIFDPADGPMMVILSDADKRAIARSAAGGMKYFAGPSEMKDKEVVKFMNSGGTAVYIGPITPRGGYCWEALLIGKIPAVKKAKR
jgi:hypothetical protein